MKIHLKRSSEKWRPFCLGLNVLRKFPGLQSFFMEQMFHYDCPKYIYITVTLYFFEDIFQGNVSCNNTDSISMFQIIYWYASTTRIFTFQAFTLATRQAIFWTRNDALVENIEASSLNFWIFPGLEHHYQIQLEQLECPLSETPPPPHDYPY